MDFKIAIVNSSSFGRYFPEHIDRLRIYGEVKRFDVPNDTSGKELAKLLQGYQIIIASVTPKYDREFFENKDRTLLITRHGIGYNNIDVAAATEKGTVVTRVLGEAEREAVAELSVALLLDVMRHIRNSSQRVQEGKWNERAKFMGWEVKGKTVGIIGFGNIGSRVGEILKEGFQANIIAYDPYIPAEEVKSKGAEPVSIDELVERADIISINAALSSGNYHMLSHKEFEKMKERVFIVNTSRGEIIDLEALMEALEKGRVAGVGFDVIEGEPIDANHPILKFPNVVVTPHIGAYTYEASRKMGEKVINDIEKIIKGERPEGVVNPEVWEGSVWLTK